MSARFVSLRAGLRENQGAPEGPALYQNATVSMGLPVNRSNCWVLRMMCRAMGRPGARAGLMTLASGVLGACAWVGGGGPKASAAARFEPRDTRLVHEDCALAGTAATGEDINGDGRPDRRSAFGTSTVSCRALDFDFDGQVDAWVYLDSSGRVRRREHDFDRDGVADEIAVYERGVLVEQQRSTSRAGKLDTWHFFKAGKLARTERDSNGDDYVDQWWEYPEQRTSDCPLIHSDVDGDGRPDPGATVDICRNRGSGATEDRAPAAAGANELPTQIETPVETTPAEPGDVAPEQDVEGKPERGDPP